MTEHDIGTAEAVAAEDRRLRAEAAAATRAAEGAQMRLDAYRWEQCDCPDGPQYSQREYAAMVDVYPEAIHQSVRAWKAAHRTVGTCTLGAPHPRESMQPTADMVDTGTTTPEEHKQHRTKARVGAENATIVAALAAEGGVAESTVTNNANWSATLDRAKALVREGITPADAAHRAYTERKQEAANMAALRTLVRDALKERGLDHDPKAVAAIIGACTQPPTWAAAVQAIEDEARRKQIESGLRRKEKESDAEEASRPAWLLAILAVPVAMSKVGQSEWDKIRGDVAGREWSNDEVDLLNAEIDKAQAILDRLRMLPMQSAVTPAAIIDGGTI